MKMNKIAFAVIAAICAFTFFSCELLTNPILPASILKYAPEAGELDDVPTDALANAAGDISIAADPDAALAIIDALGNKDDDEITALNDEQKANIITLTTSAVLPVNTIVSSVYDIMNQDENSSNSGDDFENIMNNVIGNIASVNTHATEVILLELVEDDSNVDLPENCDVSSVFLATISVAISACKADLPDISEWTESNLEQIGNAMEKIVEFIGFEYFDDQGNPNPRSKTPSVAAEEIINTLPNDGEPSDWNTQSLTNALTIIDRLGRKGIGMDNLAGLFTGGLAE